MPANSTGNASWPYQTYETANFTPPALKISVHANGSDGYFFFAPDGATPFELAPLIMDSYGELVWNGPKQHAFNFGVQIYQSKPVLVSWNGTLYPEPIGRGNGVVYIWDKHYEQVAEVALPVNFLEQVPNATYPSSIDVHEVYITPKGSMLVTANNVTQADLTSVGGPANGWVVEAQVYEIDIATNEVLFEWKSLEHLDQIPLTASVLPLGAGRRQWYEPKQSMGLLPYQCRVAIQWWLHPELTLPLQCSCSRCLGQRGMASPGTRRWRLHSGKWYRLLLPARRSSHATTPKRKWHCDFVLVRQPQ